MNVICDKTVNKTLHVMMDHTYHIACLYFNLLSRALGMADNADAVA